MQSIAFTADLIPLEKPSGSISIGVGVQFAGPYAEVEYTLHAESLRREKLQAFAWETGDSPFSETLWKKSCFELSVADRETGQYWEWNFSPIGRWGAFSFSHERWRCPAEARRDGGLVQLTSDKSAVADGVLKVKARLDLSLMSSWLAWARFREVTSSGLDISLNAITENVAGERVHWGLKHLPNGKADFHARENFTTLETFLPT